MSENENLVFALALAGAAMPFLDSTDALELASGIACWERENVTAPAIAGALEHRQRHFALACVDVEKCSVAMARAAERVRSGT